jgi:tRNA threonylcarbamoyladenosine biosynthesis protein TsaE
MWLRSDSYTETLKIGKKLAEKLKNNDIILLFGELGSGKTALTRGIAQGLGVKSSLVISPSFVILRQYTGRQLSINHFDFYRLQKVKDIFALGYEDYFYCPAVTIVEWAERLEGFLPQEYLKVEFFVEGKTKRRFKVSAFGRRYQALIDLMGGNS